MGTAMGSMAPPAPARSAGPPSRRPRWWSGSSGSAPRSAGSSTPRTAFVDDVGTFPDLDLNLSRAPRPRPTSLRRRWTVVHRSGRRPRRLTSARLPSSRTIVSSCATSRATSVRSMRRPEAHSGTSWIGGSLLRVEFAPVVVDGVVYVSGNDPTTGVVAATPAGSGVFALDAATGSRAMGGSRRRGRRIPDRGRRERCVRRRRAARRARPRTGAVRWSAPVGNDKFSGYSQPAVTGPIVVVGGGDGRVHAIDRVSGAERWTTVVSEPVRTGAGPNVSATEQLVYVTSPDRGSTSSATRPAPDSSARSTR